MIWDICEFFARKTSKAFWLEVTKVTVISFYLASVRVCVQKWKTWELSILTKHKNSQ